MLFTFIDKARQKVVVVERSSTLRFLCFLLLPPLLNSCATVQEAPPVYPLLTEIAPKAVGDASPWIELHNPHDRAAVVSGTTLIIDDVFRYTIPAKTPPIPARGYLVVDFDGKGAPANTYQYKNDAIVLHAPADLTRALRHSGAGQIALYAPADDRTQKLIGFIAWGAAGSRKSVDPQRAALWDRDWFIPLQESFGDYDADAALPPNYTIGLQPGKDPTRRDSWVLYSATEATRGVANPLPRPKIFTLRDDAVVRSEDIAIGWRGSSSAKRYEFQLATDADFKDLVEETVLESTVYRPRTLLPEGAYYYRVRAVDEKQIASEWSEPRRLISKRMSLPRSRDDGAVTEKVLTAMVHKYQRKDTALLCLDGDASDLDVTTVKQWDSSHPNAVPNVGDHGDMNCVRASIAMMVSFYGKSLSQDRIAFFTEEDKTGVGNGIPEGDLAHGIGMSYSSIDGGEETEALEWALDATTTFMDGTPTFAQIQGWIDGDRPIMTRRPGHLRTMNGYRIDDADEQWVHILDPWSGPRWETYATWAGEDRGTWVGPATAPTARSDESTIAMDTDGDGIMDFDELERFTIGRFDGDSDNDGVSDKDDIREYVFDAGDSYDKRTADIDGDGVRKESDPDNDADTFSDGCEDTNFNGKYEPALGETDNFAASAGVVCTEKPIHAIVVFDRSGSMVYPPSDPVKKYDEAASATALFLDTWLANDPPALTKVGLVFYDHTAYFDTDAATDTTLELFTEGKRDKINASFAVNRPDYGSTSIGGGLAMSMNPAGFDVAGTPVDGQHRTVIVLTDGKENASPAMDDPAVVSALAAAGIDGYVLGIGDSTQIDSDKLDSLSDILNHYPASLATDLTNFEVEKFFLQALAETQGLEFSTDPGYDIVVGTSDERAVPVALGTQRASFIVVWNSTAVRLPFSLRDPEGNPVTPDTVHENELYRVATVRWPQPGNWTLTVSAEPDASTSTSAIVRYSVMALEKNSTIASSFRVVRARHFTGEPMLLEANLAASGVYLRGADVTVEATVPDVGFGHFLATRDVSPRTTYSPPEKDVKLSPLDRRLNLLAAQKLRPATKKVVVALNDEGRNGDAVADDGRYSARFDDTASDGIYKFRFLVRDKLGPRELVMSREQTRSIVVSPKVSVKTSAVQVIKREYRAATGSTHYRLSVVPKDSAGNRLGAGYGRLLATDAEEATTTAVRDKLDGSYELEVMIPGRHTGPVRIRPSDRLRIGTWPTPEKPK